MIDRTDLGTSPWRTSSYSTGGNQCVEVAVLPAGHVAVRDSKDRGTGMHVFSPVAWTTFVHAVKTGSHQLPPAP
jgi:Domain of unknown function (DUF397)